MTYKILIPKDNIWVLILPNRHKEQKNSLLGISRALERHLKKDLKSNKVKVSVLLDNEIINETELSNDIKYIMSTVNLFLEDYEV